MSKNKDKENKLAEVKKFRADNIKGQDPAEVTATFSKMVETYKKGFEFNRSELTKREAQELKNHVYQMQRYATKLLKEATEAMKILNHLTLSNPEEMPRSPEEL